MYFLSIDLPIVLDTFVVKFIIKHTFLADIAQNKGKSIMKKKLYKNCKHLCFCIPC